MSKPRFCLIGAAGYIAPRHFEAIKSINGNLVAVLDPHDSVGILDRYFPNCKYFREFERFDRFCSSAEIDYCTIASPNYLHDAHCRFALRIGAEAICEKPVVLYERNLDELIKFEEKNNGKINCIYQLRLHDSVKAIQNVFADNDVFWKYYSPRGSWFRFSWKNSIRKSGGLETNIACHLFDLCGYLFGRFERLIKVEKSDGFSKGVLVFERAKVGFEISINEPEKIRKMVLNNTTIDFTEGFEDLHIKSYRDIIDGKGIALEEVREGLRACEAIRKI